MMDGSGRNLHPRRIFAAIVLASTACLLFATRVFVDFRSVRVKAVQQATAASAGRVEVKSGDEKLDTLETPIALIARIHNSSAAPQELVAHVDGRRVCAATLPGNTRRRIDCAIVSGWAPGASHDVSFTGTGPPFTLDYLELATHHGHTTGIFTAVVLPARSRQYVGVSGWSVGALWGALVLLLLLEPRPFESRVARASARVFTIAVLALSAVVLLSSVLSPYLVVISVPTFAAAVILATLSRTWPRVIRASAPIVAAARTLPARARAHLFQAVRGARAIWNWMWSSASQPWLAATVAVAVSASTVMYGPRAVGGADEYGYVSQAELWLNGNLKIDQPFAKQAPWRDAGWTFAPLGYRPHPHDHGVIVPVYSPGLPLLFALAKLIGGQQAIFYVVPLSAGFLVLATYAIGRRLGAGAAGVIGATLVATSPLVLFMTVTTMTDVPVAAAWAWAFYLLTGPTVRTAGGAGLLSALAILIRPNLAPLAVVLALHYVLTMRHADSRRHALRQLLAFSAGLLPGILAVSAINAYLYGSPFTSGYGELSGLFAWSRVPTNIRLYLQWFAEVHTPFAFCGFIAILIPVRRLWPGVSDRSLHVIIAAFVLSVWGIYCAWLVFDTWWFTRFLLPSWPFIMLGVGSVVVAAYRSSARSVRPLVAASLVALVSFQLDNAVAQGTFDTPAARRRFVAVARLVHRMTDENSLIVSLDHSGSIRYYGGRMTMNYSWIPPGESLDAIVDWLKARGVRTYLAAEEDELPAIKQRLGHNTCLGVLGGPPVAMYERPGKMLLYDLTRQRSPDERPTIEIDVDIGPKAALPVPPPRLIFRDAR
jgi:Dolichyl-phosphate-mannose-protein mannosyltransferase